MIKKYECQDCGKVVIPEKEDNRADTDHGVKGEVNYFCPECDADMTEQVSNE